MTPDEQFLRELTRERFARPVRKPQDNTRLTAPASVLAELVREVVPYRIDADGVTVIGEVA